MANPPGRAPAGLGAGRHFAGRRGAPHPAPRGGHYLACVLADGQGCTLFYDVAPGRVAEGVPRILQVADGPLVGFLLIAVGVLLAKRGTPHAIVFGFCLASIVAARPRGWLLAHKRG